MKTLLVILSAFCFSGCLMDSSSDKNEESKSSTQSIRPGKEFEVVDIFKSDKNDFYSTKVLFKNNTDSALCFSMKYRFGCDGEFIEDSEWFNLDPMTETSHLIRFSKCPANPDGDPNKECMRYGVQCTIEIMSISNFKDYEWSGSYKFTYKYHYRYI